MLVAGVDDHGLARGFVAEDSAVALERADGEDLEDHAFYCRARVLDPSSAAQAAAFGGVVARLNSLRKKF